jgi:hypothetical protein
MANAGFPIGYEDVLFPVDALHDLPSQVPRRPSTDFRTRRPGLRPFLPTVLREVRQHDRVVPAESLFAEAASVLAHLGPFAHRIAQ